MTARNKIFRVAVFVLSLVAVSCSTAPKKPTAHLTVSGLGWVANRDARQSLERLLGSERTETLNANAVEDAMFLLMSSVQGQGYLHPVMRVQIVDRTAKKTEFTFDESLAAGVPRDVQAVDVRFHVEAGTRYYFKEVKFSGLHAVQEKTALEYFAGQSALFQSKGARVYTPSRLSRAVESVQTELRQLGYAEADVRASSVLADDHTGEVKVQVDVREGERWEIGAINVAGTEGIDVPLASVQQFVGHPWSDLVQQDVASEIRKSFFSRGYPDVRIRVTREPAVAADGRRAVKVTAQVRPGALVKVGEPRFEGAEHMRESVLRQRVNAKPGEPLNPTAMEQARYRLARLGVFDAVDLRYEPRDGDVRSPVFALREGRLLETNLLFGYGSYEELRAGVELRQFNLFGRAHQSRALLVQSMKSTHGEYSYTVPELFGESIDGTVKLFGLQRQEVAFLRQEYGGTASLATVLPRFGVTATAGYTFQALRNRDNELSTRGIDDKQVTVASIDGGLTRDRLDNPLLPHHGYRAYARVEFADRDFGGQAEYQRFELGGSYHTSWGSGRWVHVGLSHGVITTWGTGDQLLPVNKRFFPGGENSIRGYRAGEASPRGADGRFIGAKSYLLANLELEQMLTAKWAGVVFLDSLGAAAELKHYPFDEKLLSAGLGVRYQTLIGPIRLEYGRNLRHRDGDPRGTWQLSVGYPF